MLSELSITNSITNTALVFFLEFNSQQEMFTGLLNGSVDRILIPNYFDIPLLQAREPSMKLLSVVNVVHEPFDTGLALANKQDSNNKAFISCLRKKVKSFQIVWNSNNFGTIQLKQNYFSLAYKTGSIKHNPYWTSRKNSLELIELSSINKVSLV